MLCFHVCIPLNGYIFFLVNKLKSKLKFFVPQAPIVE